MYINVQIGTIYDWNTMFSILILKNFTILVENDILKFKEILKFWFELKYSYINLISTFPN